MEWGEGAQFIGERRCDNLNLNLIDFFLSVATGPTSALTSVGVDVDSSDTWLPMLGDGGAVDTGLPHSLIDSGDGLPLGSAARTRCGDDPDERDAAGPLSGRCEVDFDERDRSGWPPKMLVSAGELWTRLEKKVERVDGRRWRCVMSEVGEKDASEGEGGEWSGEAVRSVSGWRRASWLPRRLSRKALVTPSERDRGGRGAIGGDL